MRIQLSDHFTYRKLIRFVIPSIIMMIFTSIYSVVDGLFISNFAGKTAFAAINLIFPPFMILGALGFMLGVGGTAVVAQTFGMGEKERANRYFSLIIYATIVLGFSVTLIGQLIIPYVATWLGAEGQMYKDCITYGRIFLCGVPFFMLQNAFQSFFVTAEKPKLGLFVTVGAGCMNIILDALFVAVFKWGLVGAGFATLLSQISGAVVPFIYFARKNDSLLRLGKTNFDGKMLLKSCSNGLSEFMSNISSSVVTMLYNAQLMRFAGEDGIAAYGVIGYASFIFAAIFYGYSIGSSPIVGFHYGADNPPELKNMVKKSTVLMLGTGVAMTVSSILLARPMASIFVSYDAALLSLTTRALAIYSIHFILGGIVVYASAFFTALGNGIISAVISFSRTFLFEGGCVLLLPLILDIDGIWFAMVAADFLTFLVVLYFFFTQRNRYKYF